MLYAHILINYALITRTKDLTINFELARANVRPCTFKLS